MPHVLLCLLLLCVIVVPCGAVTITSGSPGNVFVAGDPVELAIGDARGEVIYEVVDYFGVSRSGGRASSKILLEGLEPGWYQVSCKDDAGEVSASVGVVMDRGGSPPGRDGRVCVDVAGAWLTKPENFKPLARMIGMAGIPWVRERLSWGGTQAANGRLSWGKYQAIADAYAAEGVHICQHWSDTPNWTRPDNKVYPLPDDLRDLYHYARAASSHFMRQVEAWEVWNEPDSGISSFGLYAGMLKATYLGLKAGNPKAQVLLGSLCRGVTNFSKGLLESGCADYCDAFNWHIYSEPSNYPSAFAAHLNELRRYGAADRPAWLTEAGVVVRGSEGPSKRILNTQDQRTQCRFIPRSLAMSLAAGTDKHFFFVALDYTEGDIQWGALRPDLTPYPSFLALSAGANIIGESLYRGEYKTGNADVVAQVFSTRRGNVLVAWSDRETELVVPTDRRTVRVANIFGAERRVESAVGAVKVSVGPDAVYVLDIGTPIEGKLTGSPRRLGKQPDLNPSPIVLVGHSDLAVMKDSDAHKLADEGEFDYSVDVYNFDEVEGASGFVRLVAPEGWTVREAKRKVTVDPMGREVLVFHVKPGKPRVGRHRIVVRGDFGSKDVSPAVSAFSFDPALLLLSRTRPLDWADDSARWQPDASPGCDLTLSNPELGVLRSDMVFAGAGDRWAYPILRFDSPFDMSGFSGIAFDLAAADELPNTLVRLMLVERGGAHYVSATPVPVGKHRVVFLFENMERLDFMGSDDNGRLDLDEIREVKFGCNARQERLSLDVSGFQLVSFK